MSENKFRTRFAPSPTGYLHIGGLRTAAYAYSLAKHNNGQFILRIEDTDQKREVQGATQKLQDILKTFHLNWDEGPNLGGPHAPYTQSERVSSGIYKAAAEKLINEDHAFYCFCKAQTKEELKESWNEKRLELRDPCRSLSPEEVQYRISNNEPYAIRLKVPDNEKIIFYDFVLKKDTVWDSKDVDDAMLLKSDGFPTYHLAVVVDDHAMQITHVIRAMEWFPSTPIHVLVYKYLGYSMPEFGHPTAILDPEGGKLSKRKGNVSCEQFLEEGYLPEALLNFVILLGWAPKDNRELFTLEDFVQAFDINGFQKSNPIFNITKLDWFNGHYIRQKSDNELFELFKPYIPENANEDIVKTIIPLIKERVHKLSDFQFLAGFFFNRPDIDRSLLSENYNVHFEKVISALLPSIQFTVESLNECFNIVCFTNNFDRRNFFMDLRVAITGQKVTPPLNESMVVLGKEEVLSRLSTLI